MIRLNSGTYLMRAGIGERDALQHLRHELLRIVHELLHQTPLSATVDDCFHAAASCSAIIAMAIGSGIVGAAAAFARVGRAAALGDPRLDLFGLLAGDDAGRLQCASATLPPARTTRANSSDGGHERIEQRLVAEVRLARASSFPRPPP